VPSTLPCSTWNADDGVALDRTSARAGNQPDYMIVTENLFGDIITDLAAII